MIGMKLKRALTDLLLVEAANVSSPLYRIQVSYVRPPNVEQKSVWLGEGLGPARSGVAEGVVEIDSAIVPVVVRVTGATGSERDTDTAAEALGNVVSSVVSANRGLAGVNTQTSVSGRLWTNPSTDDDAVTELTVEITAEGYA